MKAEKIVNIDLFHNPFLLLFAFLSFVAIICTITVTDRKIVV